MTAGNGLTGGGYLSVDRTIALGTPGTVSGSTPNAVTTESHTHAVAVATDAVSGAVELATGDETVTGTDAVRAVTPAGLATLTATTARRGLVELATGAETVTGTDAERAVTPSALKTALLATFPVGAIYITAGNTNPGTFLGGTWVQIAEGRTLIGVGTLSGDTYAAGATGGAASVSLTIGQMPAHDHGGATGVQSADHTHSGTVSSAGGHTHATNINKERDTGSGIGNYQTTNAMANAGDEIQTDSAGGHTHTITLDNSSASHAHAVTTQGGGGAHENRMPYLAVYFWQRTA